MLSDWSRMIRKNWVIPAGSSSAEASNRVSTDPLMADSGVLSSWLTMPRNSANAKRSWLFRVRRVCRSALSL